MYKKILVPTDASDFSKKALMEAINMAQIAGSEIVLLNVPHSPDSYWGYTASYGIEVKEEALEQLGKLALEITLSDITTNVPIKQMIKYGNPVSQIMETIKEEGIDMVIMGSHGHGFISGTIIGSVSQKVLHQAEIPVLIIK
ncbi:MAG TPA: universal stress protein [Eubacteriaceae bacterium]|nr:universal stress protein [Eubacteriaceae bacterium]